MEINFVIYSVTKKNQKIICRSKKILFIFAALNMVIVAQLVRASDCGSEGRGFESHHSPIKR
jgi:hypothetical protein